MRQARELERHRDVVRVADVSIRTTGLDPCMSGDTWAVTFQLVPSVRMTQRRRPVAAARPSKRRDLDRSRYSPSAIGATHSTAKSATCVATISG